MQKKSAPRQGEKPQQFWRSFRARRWPKGAKHAEAPWFGSPPTVSGKRRLHARWQRAWGMRETNGMGERGARHTH